ncbi:MAG: hypothetical protein ACRECX_12395 [Methyloceanibacter sp.]|uniref:hypothetical protein n=1 Tax=Methyloceanibacter sp. TaxID=1965321 RepID=UPI003D6D6A46
MTDTTQETATGAKRFRSPPYPAIALSKAIERAKELYGHALHHPAGVKVLAEAWSYGQKSSGLWATAAALLQFGLLTDEGSGDKRKFQLTDAALRIVRDADPTSPKRLDAIKRAALTPKIHKELWDLYGQSPAISDVVLKNHLTLDRSEGGEAAYSDAAASALIDVYKDTISFAGLHKSGTVPQDAGDMHKEKEDREPPRTPAKIGDYVQWNSGGIDQFKPPRKVVWVSNDGSHLRVHGSQTGIPMSEITVAAAPAPQARGGVQTGSYRVEGSESKADISVLQIGDRLEIMANVDAAGLKKLKELLDHYEKILGLLKPKS